MTDERKEIDASMLQYSREVLRRWCSEAEYDLSEFEPVDFDRLAAWVAAYEIHKINPDVVDRPRKCLWICGECGKGKTALARILRDKLDIPMRYADDISKGLDEKNMYPCDYRIVTSPGIDLIIDDLGAETLRRNYGNESEFPQLLFKLYDLWRYSGKLLIATSNYSLTSKGLLELRGYYGERITDRITEMFVSIPLTGQTNWRQRDRG